MTENLYEIEDAIIVEEDDYDKVKLQYIGEDDPTSVDEVQEYIDAMKQKQKVQTKAPLTATQKKNRKRNKSARVSRRANRK